MQDRLSGDFNVSIHAPVRGATDYTPIEMSGNISFNPRTREGCDAVLVIPLQVHLMFQSTHP